MTQGVSYKVTQNFLEGKFYEWGSLVPSLVLLLIAVSHSW